MKALLIIDMVKGFLNESTKDGKCALHLPDARLKIDAINWYMADMKEKDIVMHIRDAHKPTDAELEYMPRHCMKDSEESEIAHGFEYSDHKAYIFDKNTFSGLFETPVYYTLKSKYITDITIVGVCTDICVLHTATAARFYGLNVTIYEPGCSGLTVEGHEYAIDYMKNILGCEIER